MGESSLTLLSVEDDPSEVSHRDISPFGPGEFPEDLTKGKLSELMEQLVEKSRKDE